MDEPENDNYNAPPPAGPSTPTAARIDALINQLRDDLAASLERLTTARDDAARHRAAAEAATRAYAAEWRSVKARGLLTPTQLREAGFPAPRTRPHRGKPNS